MYKIVIYNVFLCMYFCFVLNNYWYVIGYLYVDNIYVFYFNIRLFVLKYCVFVYYIYVVVFICKYFFLLNNICFFLILLFKKRYNMLFNYLVCFMV